MSEFLTLLGILISIAAAYLAIRESRRIAKSSGWLKAPQLILRYGLAPFAEQSPRALNIVYGMPPKFKREYVGTFRIIIENLGKRAAENVKLDIVLPSGANSGGEYLEVRAKRGLLPGFARECFRIDKLLHVCYYIPLVNPGETISLDEPFWLEKTIDVQSSVTIPTADKKKVKVTYNMTFSFVFRLSLRHKEGKPLDTEVHLHVMEETAIENLVNNWVKLEEEKEGAYPNDGTEKEQARWLLNHAQEREIYFVLPAFDKIKILPRKSLSFEDFAKSQRWQLRRVNGRWELSKCTWTFQ